MRQIKFRSWNGKKMHLPEYSDQQDFFVTPEGEVRYIHEVGVEGHKTDSFRKGWELMQYTGLKDKNGKEIFEGDIVKWDDGSNGNYWRVAVVEYNPDLQLRIVKNTVHRLSRPEGYIFSYGNFAYKKTELYLEVLGNIHEHPELLTPSLNRP